MDEKQKKEKQEQRDRKIQNTATVTNTLLAVGTFVLAVLGFKNKK